MDVTARRALVGERGEICIKGPQAAKSYWNNPHMTIDITPVDVSLRIGNTD